MKHITVGVAGHIDHGKTALVRALTGTETDRLKEEQERGMTIVLGFAHLTLPDGEIDFIDVPGHEKFVRTMIAGATGIDAALLVVSAQERIKPQTVEHIALMELLGVKRGIVAVTKSDLIPDDDERMLVSTELGGFLRDTFLADTSLIFVSAHSGEGIDALREALGLLLSESDTPEIYPDFTLPIDRVFTITGQGTVVTGTLRRGALQVGQTVEILPRGLRAEVRGLQVHGQAVSAASPGWRTAVNLRGVKKEDLSHGDTLATAGVLRPTRIADAELNLLASIGKPLRRGQAAVLHHGTTEVQARIYPLGKSEVLPGEQAYVQMRLSKETVVSAGEPFVVRLFSPAETIGGGRIFDPYPLKHTQVDDSLLQHLARLASGSPSERFLAKLEESGPGGRDPEQLASDLGFRDSTWSDDIRFIRCAQSLVLHPVIFDELKTQTVQAVLRFHDKHPTKRGMPSEELRRQLPPLLKPAVFTTILQVLSDMQILDVRESLVQTPGYSPEAALSQIEREIVRELESQFQDGGLRPPDIDTVVGHDRRRKTLYFYLVEAGTLIPATDRLSGRTVVFHQAAIKEIEPVLQESLVRSDGLRVSELNQVLGTTRKFSVPLLEYLDSIGLTRRDGDLRFWNGKDSIID